MEQCLEDTLIACGGLPSDSAHIVARPRALAAVKWMPDKRLAANARRLVEQRYDWDAIGRRFVALVEETVSFRKRKR